MFKNPSGTAQAGSLYAATVGILTAAGTGNFGVAAGIGGTVALSNMTARLMTNPNFVRWLAYQTKVPKSAYTAQLNGLVQMAEKNDDPELWEAVRLIRSQEASILGNQGKGR